jgi:hypothetical protein
MEHLMHWIVELNKHHHTGYAMLTVVTMAGMGCVFASLIELLFMLLGIRYHNKPCSDDQKVKHLPKTCTGQQEREESGKWKYICQ